MTPRPLLFALGFAIAIFSLSATGQMNYGNAPSPAASPPATQAAPTPVPETPATTTSAPANTMHATGKHMHHARHGARASHASAAPPVAMSGTGDPAYHAALQQCVAGPMVRRETCLDDAITRYSHS